MSAQLSWINIEVRDTCASRRYLPEGGDHAPGLAANKENEIGFGHHSVRARAAVRAAHAHIERVGFGDGGLCVQRCRHWNRQLLCELDQLRFGGVGGPAISINSVTANEGDSGTKNFSLGCIGSQWL